MQHVDLPLFKCVGLVHNIPTHAVMHGKGEGQEEALIEALKPAASARQRPSA